MAVNRGVTLFVLLLYYCHRAEQPVNTPSGPATEISPRSNIQEHIPGLVDEILVQEILSQNKSSTEGTTKTAITSSPVMPKGKNETDNTDENEEVSSEPSENSEFSLDGEEKIRNNASCTNDSYQVRGPEAHHESWNSSREDRVFSNEKKDSKNNPDESLSVLDKILKKIGKVSGNLSNKLKRTSKAQRAESGQHGHKLREISVKNEILTE